MLNMSGETKIVRNENKNQKSTLMGWYSDDNKTVDFYDTCGMYSFRTRYSSFINYILQCTLLSLFTTAVQYDV